MAKVGLGFICVYVVVSSKVGRIRWFRFRIGMADWEVLDLGFVDSMKIWAKRVGIGLAD